MHISNIEQCTENVLKWTEPSHIKETIPSKYHDSIIGTTVLHNCLSKHNTLRKNCFLLPLWIFFYLVRNKKSLRTFCLLVCNFWYADTLVVLQCWYMHYSHIQQSMPHHFSIHAFEVQIKRTTFSLKEGKIFITSPFYPPAKKTMYKQT